MSWIIAIRRRFQGLREIHEKMKHVTIACLIAVWLALALLVGLIGSAAIGCQWIAERVRK